MTPRCQVVSLDFSGTGHSSAWQASSWLYYHSIICAFNVCFRISNNFTHIYSHWSIAHRCIPRVLRLGRPGFTGVVAMRTYRREVIVYRPGLAKNRVYESHSSGSLTRTLMKYIPWRSTKG